MLEYIIDGEKYHKYDEVIAEYPRFKNGSRSKAAFVEVNKMPDDAWTYAREWKDGWQVSDGSSCRSDKFFINVNYYQDNIEQKNKVQDNIEQIAVRDILPTEIHLSDQEKFKDNEGTPLRMRVYGERNVNKCYFRLVDVATAFGMKKLRDTVTRKNGGYILGEHYKKFYHDVTDMGLQTKCEVIKFATPVLNGTDKVAPTNCGNSNTVITCLTYLGLLKVLFASKNNVTKNYISWATETLFAVQLGTPEQKEQIAGNLMGIPVDQLRTMLKSNVTPVSCIYLFSIGTIDGIPGNIYKYGYTQDLSIRASQHKKEYGKNVSLVLHGCIDNAYTSQAEQRVNKLFAAMNAHIVHENYKELVSLTDKQLKEAREMYGFIATKFSGDTKLISTEMAAIKHNYEQQLTKKDLEMTVMKAEKDMEISKMREDLITHSKDLEIANLKIQMAEMKYAQKL
jgi:hypothetical protein